MIDHRTNPREYHKTVMMANVIRWGIKFEHKETLPYDLYTFPYSGTEIRFYEKSVVIDEKLGHPSKPEKAKYADHGYLLERAINRALFAALVHELFKTVKKVPTGVVFKTRRTDSLFLSSSACKGFTDMEMVVEYEALQDDGNPGTRLPVLHETIHNPMTNNTAKQVLRDQIKILIGQMTAGKHVPVILPLRGAWPRIKPYGVGELVITEARLQSSVTHASSADLGFPSEDREVIVVVEKKRLSK